MSLIQFTRNHTDHSTDKGFQFEFVCDRCGNGFMSEFRASAAGYATSALEAASGLLWLPLSRRVPEPSREGAPPLHRRLTRRAASPPDRYAGRARPVPPSRHARPFAGNGAFY
jgi:hypothetical protein